MESLKREGERENGDRKFSSIGSFPNCLQHPGLGQTRVKSQEHHPGLLLSDTCQVLGPSSVSFSDALASSWIRSIADGTQTGTFMWDADVISNSLTYCATVLDL